MFDNTCKFLAENFPDDFATWLLGKPVALTKLSPTELSSEPIRADSLLLMESEELILHTEFQTLPEEEIPFRMTDYRLRGYRRSPEKRMFQVVIYLRKITSKKDLKLVKINKFKLENTTHQFHIIRLWEQPTDLFLNNPGLLPFAVLSNTSNKASTLQQVAAQINNISNKRIQNNIIASTAILAGLVLNEEVIQNLLRRDAMRESVIYQSIMQEGRQEGRQEGLQEGLQEGREEKARQIVANLLKEGVSTDLIAKVTGLTAEQIQQIQASK
jgi:predicted transposase/invertase (TIGR01784 family)